MQQQSRTMSDISKSKGRSS